MSFDQKAYQREWRKANPTYHRQWMRANRCTGLPTGRPRTREEIRRMRLRGCRIILGIKVEVPAPDEFVAKLQHGLDDGIADPVYSDGVNKGQKGTN